MVGCGHGVAADGVSDGASFSECLGSAVPAVGTAVQKILGEAAPGEDHAALLTLVGTHDSLLAALLAFQGNIPGRGLRVGCGFLLQLSGVLPPAHLIASIALRAHGTVKLVVRHGKPHGWLTMIWDIRQFGAWFDRYTCGRHRDRTPPSPFLARAQPDACGAILTHSVFVVAPISPGGNGWFES